MFKKYESITNSYDQKFINKIKEEINSTQTWIVSEKVDGCNFSIINTNNNDELIYARRNDIIPETSCFFNFQKATTPIKDNLIKLIQYIKTEYIDVAHIQIYGELFHDGIQGRVKYTNIPTFMIFDITINYKFIDFDKMYNMCKMFNIFVTEPLFRSTLDDCLKYSNEYPSTISGLLNYSLDNPEKNICEGNVIRPVTEYRLSKHNERVIIKNKNEKFSEKSHTPKVKIEINLNDIEQEVLNNLLEKININRVISAISKLGECDIKMFSVIMKEVSTDIFNEFKQEDNWENYCLIEDTNKKYINKTISFELSKLIKDYFMKKA